MFKIIRRHRIRVISIVFTITFLSCSSNVTLTVDTKINNPSPISQKILLNVKLRKYTLLKGGNNLWLSENELISNIKDNLRNSVLPHMVDRAEQADLRMDLEIVQLYSNSYWSPAFLLPFIVGLGFVGFPIGFSEGNVIIRIDVMTPEGDSLSSLVSEKKSSGLLGLYYGYTTPVAESLLSQALDDIKITIQRIGNAGWIGLEFESEGTNKNKLRINKIISNSPAERVNIKEGDEILELNGVKTKDRKSFIAIISDSKPGEKVRLKIERNGLEQEVEVVLANWASIYTKDRNDKYLTSKELTDNRSIGPKLIGSSDLERDIPNGSEKNPNAIGVIIGISKYEQDGIPRAEYAKEDAVLLKQYLIHAFGYDSRRIIELYDDEAGLSAFKRVFEEQLSNYIKDGQSDIFIYYNGHGAPDPETKEPYFVPYDCNPVYVKSTGYKVKELYEKLSLIKARNVVIVIDASFSGSTAKGMLLKNISPTLIAVENPIVSLNNGIIFISSSPKQVSSWYDEKKHALFTYYFLKGLKGNADSNNDKQITVEEMEKYLLANVPDQARYLNNREQIPQIIAKDKQTVLVKY